MRIVAGKFRGKVLAKSDHLKSLRPTTDKNREAVFNILSSAKFIKEIAFKIDGARILDLCCGSGAVAFEALSRGAKSALLIDNNPLHLELAKKNSEILKVEKEVKILCADAKNLPKNGSIQPESARPRPRNKCGVTPLIDSVQVCRPALVAGSSENFFDLIFIDPPYAEDYSKIINSLLENGWIKKDSLIVVESSEPEKILLSDFILLDLRRYGQTSFAFLKLIDQSSDIKHTH